MGPEGFARRIQHRRLIIDRQFQVKYSVILAGLGFGFCLVIGAGLLLLIRSNYDFLVSEGLIQSPSVLASVSEEQNAFFWKFFTLSTCVVTLLFFAGFYVTNRFVGPVKGIERELKKLRKGNFGAHLAFRKTDEFKQLALLFNESMQMIRDDFQSDVDFVKHWRLQLEQKQSSEAVLEAMNRWLEEKRRKLSVVT